MAFVISSISDRIDIVSRRSSYASESYYDNIDTDISQLLTIPAPSELRIQAANYYLLYDTRGNSKYPNTIDDPYRWLEDPYFPDGNPTNFFYGFMAGEHALFYVKTLKPERNLFTYKWEVNGEEKGTGPSLMLYNLSPDVYIDTEFNDNAPDVLEGAYEGFGDLVDVSCIATDVRGRETRQSAYFKCDDIMGMGDGRFTARTGGRNTQNVEDNIYYSNLRRTLRQYTDFDVNVFNDESLSEAARQSPLTDVIMPDGPIL